MRRTLNDVSDSSEPPATPANASASTGVVLDELWPTPGPVANPRVTNAELERNRPDGSPWVAMVMISSLDGAAEIDGLSGGLGAPSDMAVFGSMRAMADVIIVAGGTARAENYGPPVRRAEVIERRVQTGQREVPRIAVLSGSLDFDPESRLFERAEDRPLIYTTIDAPAERRAALEDRAEIVALDQVTPASVVADLGSRGLTVAVLEGGPSLNGQFLAADLVDEINLSVAPVAVGGDAMRITRAAVSADPRRFDLARIWTGDGILFLRYVRSEDKTSEHQS